MASKNDFDEDWLLELGPDDSVLDGWITAGIPSKNEYRRVSPFPQECVLCTDSTGHLFLGCYLEYAKCWFDVNGAEIDVIAWRALPKPYKGEKDD